MSADRMISSISSWMKAKHLLVPEDWIAACLDWISSENHNARDEVVVRKMVYEQYLLTDLRDFGIQILPNSVTEDLYNLKGTYCVQIDSVLDVSQPKYSQLLQRQNKESGNTFVTAETQATQKPWEAKPTRILMLKITDGVQEISGMEYNTIPKLSDKTPPGTKMCLKGLIKCRRGVLMLKQQNIEILGGEVEDLLVSNNYEANLCRGLGRPIPTSLQPQQTPSSLPDNPPQSDINNEDLHDILADAEFDDADFDDEIKAEIKNVPKNAGNKMDESDPSLLDILVDADNDNFMDFDDNPAKSECGIQNVDPANFDPFTASKTSAKSCNKVLTKTTSSHNKNAQNSVSKSQKALSQKHVGKETQNPNVIHSNMQISSKKSSKTSKPYTLDLKEEDIIEILDDEDDLPTFEKPKPRLQKSARILTSVNVVKIQQKELKSKPDYEPVEKKFATQKNSDNVSKLAENLSKTRPSASTTQIGINMDKTDREISLIKVTAPTDSISAHKSPIRPTEKESCSYLCHAKNYFKNSNLATFSIRVKGIVITLTSKLKSDAESGWSIGARICDGTDVLEVEFGDSVLRKLIGFSASEIDIIKQSQNSADKQKLKSGVENCRETIISMCHYMHINLKSSKSCNIVGIVTDVEF